MILSGEAYRLWASHEAHLANIYGLFLQVQITRILAFLVLVPHICNLVCEILICWLTPVLGRLVHVCLNIIFSRLFFCHDHSLAIASTYMGLVIPWTRATANFLEISDLTCWTFALEFKRILVSFWHARYCLHVNWLSLFEQLLMSVRIDRRLLFASQHKGVSMLVSKIYAIDLNIEVQLACFLLCLVNTIHGGLILQFRILWLQDYTLRKFTCRLKNARSSLSGWAHIW